MKVKNLVRPEVLALKPYVPAKKVKNKIRLNANESPYTVTEFAALNKLNLYPDARPDEIRNKIADYLNINEDCCVVTRGSTEAIDLLIRTFCSPHVDEIIIFPPTFEMYQFYAAIQGIKVVPVNLMSDHQYAIDIELFQKTVSKKSKLIFICSPSNPIGHSFDKETIYSICQEVSNSGLVVLDGAYAEFSDLSVYQDILQDFDNVVILRTLSKAFGLAGSRCGLLIAKPEICQFIMRVIPPYSFSKPAEKSVLDALSNKGIKRSQKNIEKTIKERAIFKDNLLRLDSVIKVFPSETNFLLVRVSNAMQFCNAARDSGFLLRDMSYHPTLENCVRITVGNSDQNKKLIDGLQHG